MNFSTYITIITCAMTLIGIASLSLSEGVGVSFLVLAGPITLISLYVNTNMPFRTPRGIFNALAVIAFTAFIADYLAISKHLVISSARFTALLIILKLWDLKSPRDSLILSVLAFFQVLLLSASTVSLLFFPILALFVLSAIWTMVVFNIKKDFERFGKDALMPKGLFKAGFFAATIGISVFSMIVTVMLFFTIPRAGLRFFEGMTLDTIKVSGFSDKVALGSLGPLKSDHTVIMRVGMSRPHESPLYLRGAVLDRYDGKTWHRTTRKKTGLNKKAEMFYKDLFSDNENFLKQDILLEPIETDALFAVSQWRKVAGPFKRLLTESEYGTLHLPNIPYSRINYTVWSDPERRDAFLDPLPYLKKEHISGKTTHLAKEITKGAKTDFRKAMAIEKYLKENYRYTLEPKGGRDKDPIEDFLFYTKEGWCEHYSSAMVMLLRASGVPSRLVTGFLSGEWNSFGSYYIVRQENAHSWVEVYIKNLGWVMFEPTPSSGIISPGRQTSLALYIDSLKWRWNRYIINYTLKDQISAAKAFEDNISRIRVSLKSLLNEIYSSASAFAFGGGAEKGRTARITTAIMAVILFIFSVFFLIRKLCKRAGMQNLIYRKTPPFYMEMTKILKRKGFRRNDSETPMEFAVRIGMKNAVKLTGFLHEARYGGKKPTDRESEEIKILLKEIKRQAGNPCEAWVGLHPIVFLLF